MNRLLVAAIAAALSQFALACHTDRTEIYEPAPSGQTADDTGAAGEKIDTARVSDSPGLNFPVPATVEEPVDVTAAKLIDNHIDYINGGIINPTTQMPPTFDTTRIDDLQINGVDAPGADVIDQNQINTLPGIGLNPLLVTDPAPSRGNASTQPEGTPPL
jgi:hypothetical protein